MSRGKNNPLRALERSANALADLSYQTYPAEFLKFQTRAKDFYHKSLQQTVPVMKPSVENIADAKTLIEFIDPNNEDGASVKDLLVLTCLLTENSLCLDPTEQLPKINKIRAKQGMAMYIRVSQVVRELIALSPNLSPVAPIHNYPAQLIKDGMNDETTWPLWLDRVDLALDDLIRYWIISDDRDAQQKYKTALKVVKDFKWLLYRSICIDNAAHPEAFVAYPKSLRNLLAKDFGQTIAKCSSKHWQ
jgi:hypothetical protein